MYFKSVISLPVAALVSLLHVGCCVLPMFTIAAGAAGHFAFFDQYKSVFLCLQLLALAYTSWALLRDRFGKKPFHGKVERIAYQLSFVITAAGLWAGYAEPFKSENQEIAQAQYLFIRQHRNLDLDIRNAFDAENLRKELIAIDGIKPARIRIADTNVQLTFRKDKISGAQIIRLLETRGYRVEERQ